MEISILRLAQLIMYTLPETLFILVMTLISISLIALLAYIIINWRKSKKLSKCLVFTPQQWELFNKMLSSELVKNLTEKYVIIPKDLEIRKRLCGTWCNPNDDIRYHISLHGEVYLMTAEARLPSPSVLNTYIIRRSNSCPMDPYIFYADGQDYNALVLGYDPEKDVIIIADKEGELVRLENYVAPPNPPAVKKDVDVYDVVFAESAVGWDDLDKIEGTITGLPEECSAKLREIYINNQKNENNDRG